MAGDERPGRLLVGWSLTIGPWAALQTAAPGKSDFGRGEPTEELSSVTSSVGAEISVTHNVGRGTPSLAWTPLAGRNERHGRMCIADPAGGGENRGKS